MTKPSSHKLLRIPVRYVEGNWECKYGGVVPVDHGTEAELVVSSKSVTDEAFLEMVTTKSKLKALEQGVTLHAWLATKDQEELTEEQKSCLIPWQSRLHEIATEQIDNRNSGDLSLVEVTIGDPTDQQSSKFDTESGGLWLLTEGPRAVGLQSTRIFLPHAVSTDPVNSLNHAFTKLSETYEPWRISHTGNVYQRFLYREENGKWYPLECLRQAALARHEQAIAYQLWQNFLKRMSASARRPDA